ncbi:MAG: hypothetical protein QXL94_05625 [Candidatus Parvarchaeum sp.]
MILKGEGIDFIKKSGSNDTSLYIKEVGSGMYVCPELTWNGIKMRNVSINEAVHRGDFVVSIGQVFASSFLNENISCLETVLALMLLTRYRSLNTIDYSNEREHSIVAIKQVFNLSVK